MLYADLTPREVQVMTRLVSQYIEEHEAEPTSSLQAALQVRHKLELLWREHYSEHSKREKELDG